MKVGLDSTFFSDTPSIKFVYFHFACSAVFRF